MKRLKRLITIVLSLLIATTIMPTTNVHAISFVNLFTSLTGEVVNIIPAQSVGHFVEIEREYGVSRFYIGQDTYVLGENIFIGDTITVYFRIVALSNFEGEVLGMTPTAPNQYDVLIEYTRDWLGGGENGIFTFHVDFSRTFLHERFEVGDTITAFYNPWGVPNIFDMPQYHAELIVNGDYDVYLGSLYENMVSNFIRGGGGYEGRELNITNETIIIAGNGEPFFGELTNHSHLALVFTETGAIDKVIVIWQLTSIEVTGGLPLDQITERLIRDIEPTIGEIIYPVIFTEMPSSWAVEQVANAVRLGLVPENLQSDFSTAITRLEFASLAVNLYEYIRGEITGHSNTFIDTDNESVAKATFIGIISGVGDNRFDPDGALTREQTAVMLQRLFRLLESHSVLIDLPVLDMPHLPSTFTDYSQISSWAYNAVAWTYGIGIMRGTGNRMFSPRADYTREQSIVTIMHIFGFVDEVHVYDVDKPTIRVTIYIPDIPTPAALELICESENSRYYLPSISSGIIMLTFEDGIVVSLREALDQEKITVTDLILNGLRIFVMPQLVAVP